MRVKPRDAAPQRSAKQGSRTALGTVKKHSVSLKDGVTELGAAEEALRDATDRQ